MANDPTGNYSEENVVPHLVQTPDPEHWRNLGVEAQTWSDGLEEMVLVSVGQHSSSSCETQLN